MMPINDSVARLELVVGSGIVLREPGREQPVPMAEGALERMCIELEGRGEHDEAARHRRDLAFLQTIAQRMADAPGACGAERS